MGDEQRKGQTKTNAEGGAPHRCLATVREVSAKVAR